MKFPRGSVILLTAILLVTISIEQAFSLPVLTIMILLVQQPLLSDGESTVLAGLIGLLVSVVYHLPFAVGIAIFILAIGVSRAVLRGVHVQARDAGVTLAVCAALAWFMKFHISAVNLAFFTFYFLVVILFIRLWISRRAFHAKFRI